MYLVKESCNNAHPVIARMISVTTQRSLEVSAQERSEAPRIRTEPASTGRKMDEAHNSETMNCELPLRARKSLASVLKRRIGRHEKSLLGKVEHVDLLK